MSSASTGTSPRHGSTGQEPPRNRRPVVVGLAVVALIALVVGIGVAVLGGDEGSGGASAVPPAPKLEELESKSRAPVQTSMGVYSQGDPEKVKEFEDWSGVKTSYVIDFSSRDTWEEIADPDYFLNVWEDSDARLVWGVAMLPSDDDGEATIGAGAEGRYDHYFRELAEHLVEHNQGNAVLRLGWEFNLSISRWKTSDPELYIKYWRSVVDTMRSVDGADFSFDWNMNNGDNNEFDAAVYYPGDKWVDVIGVDVYDVSNKSGTYPYPANCDDYCRSDRQTRAWEMNIYGGERGLKYWSAFAASHGKAMSLPEWGVWDADSGYSGGDNPMFIQYMYDFITDPANNVAYQSYFEFDNDKVKHSLINSFPQSGAKYRELWGSG